MRIGIFVIISIFVLGIIGSVVVTYVDWKTNTDLGNFKIPTKYYDAMKELPYSDFHVCNMKTNQCVVLRGIGG